MSEIFDLKASNIENLELKLKGELPINRDELLALANSWGRETPFCTYDKNNIFILINSCNEKEKYNLSNLDVSEITNFDSIFKYSYFNGDINNWNTSNAINMNSTFAYTTNFNSPLDKWNISSVTSIYCMFYETKKFNQNLNSWDTSKIIDFDCTFNYSKEFNQPILWDISKAKTCVGMFYNAKTFENRFNDGKGLQNDTMEIKNWLIKNKPLMEAIEIEDNKSKELDNFLENFENKKNGLREYQFFDIFTI